MTPLKEHNNFPVTDSRDRKIYDLPDKEFKIAIFKRLKKGEKIERQLDKIRK